MQFLRIILVAAIMVLQTALLVAQTPGGPGTEDFPTEQTNDVNENSVPAVPLGNDVWNIMLILSFGIWSFAKRKNVINANH